ncbi:MAG: four helix bundle protein [Bacteroidota bacterium]
MAKVSCFENLEVWQKAREFSQLIHETSNKGTFKKDFSLKDQINRSVGSIMDNIAEGFERGGNKEFIQFLSYSKGSSGEVRSQLYRALDKAHIEQLEFDFLKSKSIELSKQLSGFMSYLKTSEMRGVKYMKEPTESYSINSPNLES